MSVIAAEGVVDHGVVRRLTSNAVLPEGARVYVIVPGVAPAGAVHLRSPHLARSEDAADFMMRVVEQ